ncbi:MAG: SHOCT domain-containing protein [Thermoleophilaceae bacterium]
MDCAGGMLMGGGALMMLYPLFVLILIALAIVWIARSVTRPASATQPGPEDALAVLRRRYASGEMDEDEYERRRRTLTQP